MRHAAAVLITLAVTVLSLTAATASRAQSAFDGPQSAGVTVGAGLLAGMICWTVELANAESRFDDAPRVEREDDYERTGWFAGFKAVSATEFLDEAEEDKNIGEAFEPFNVRFEMDNNNTSGGISFLAGRRCHPRFSVEIDFEWVDEFKGKITDTDTGKLAAKVNFAPFVGTVNLKGYFLTGRYQPYGLIGVGLMSIESDTRSSTGAKNGQTTGLLAIRFGGGIDYYITRNWLLNLKADYLYSATDIQTLDYLSIGIGFGYRF